MFCGLVLRGRAQIRVFLRVLVVFINYNHYNYCGWMFFPKNAPFLQAFPISAPCIIIFKDIHDG